VFSIIGETYDSVLVCLTTFISLLLQPNDPSPLKTL